MKLRAMAEAYGVALAPHCPLGPGALAARLQIYACTPNVFIQEQSLGIHYTLGGDLLDYLEDSTVFAYQEGYVWIPSGPGLGVEVDEEAVLSIKEGHDLRVLSAGYLFVAVVRLAE